MTERTISASRFKAECLGLMDDVATSGEPVIVTKRGKPLVRVLPFQARAPLTASVTFLVSDDETAKPLDEDWDAAADD